MTFSTRHIGPNTTEQNTMLNVLGYDSLDDFINFVVPEHLRSRTGTTDQNKLSEYAALQKLNAIMSKNKLYKNYIGMGYSETITPSVIKRNVFENPGWYTAYTPYQAEISQGRLEALLNYQQMIMDLTGFNLANASLLDEATAAAEAMLMAFRINNASGNKFFVDANALPQTLEVIKTRAKYANIEVIAGNMSQCQPERYFGVFIQNPNVYGQIQDYTQIIANLKLQQPNLVVIMACDILSLVLFKSPQTQGSDIAIGNTQRFGIPLGFGGPAAAYIATKDEYRRLLPGRVIGVSVDSRGKKALRMALQTREQHIRREKATSNICTSQVLLANMAGFYAVYHGAAGLKCIATKIHHLTLILQDGFLKLGYKIVHNGLVFDTLSVVGDDLEAIYQRLLNNGYLAGIYKNTLLISLGEITEIEDIYNILNAFASDITASSYLEIKQNLLNFKFNSTNEEISFIPNKTTTVTNAAALADNKPNVITSISEAIFSSAEESNKYIDITVNLKEYESLYRKDPILTTPVFNQYYTETKMMRYLKSLENKDISLVHSMIPLGSCTMKLNAASELEPLSWQSVANIHPFAPKDTVAGYLEMIDGLREQLNAITGFADISMQPNSGAQGEYAGLLAIRRYQESIGQVSRNICLIPKSAHGTNPATAHMMGLEVVMVNCDERGNIDVADLEAKAIQYKNHLSCLMITYPSTHGVFEVAITQICDIIHTHGGQVYMDGANLNALVGLIKPAELGADVAHINLHKTFAIPHGGGGPGMGPIGVKEHLVKFLPSHIYLFDTKNPNTNALHTEDSNAVSAAPFGSSSILTISWMYITLMGELGLSQATKVAILNANYIASKLKHAFPILYMDKNGMIAHECILDLRPIKSQTGITEVDIAKRLMDYGFHAPTMSFPVPGTLMVEPTESEALDELERFVAAMLSIYAETQKVGSGEYDKINNPLKNAPHTLADIINWDKPYSIEVGCFPLPYLKENKIFPSVNRIDDVYGDRNFMCSCDSVIPA